MYDSLRSFIESETFQAIRLVALLLVTAVLIGCTWAIILHVRRAAHKTKGRFIIWECPSCLHAAPLQRFRSSCPQCGVPMTRFGREMKE